MARAGIIDGEIDLATMGTRPRRRREKKLMTMEEVNERFPLTKYKMWQASREAEGLPAAGGVDPMDVAGAKVEAATIDTTRDAKNSSETARPPTALSLAQQDHAHAQRETITPTETTAAATSSSEKSPEKTAVARTQSADSVTTPATENQPQDNAATTHAAPQVREEEEEDEDDPIRTAAPPEMLSAPGDSCAICIDNLDDEDDVRGLTCGHAFHAACVDPWLTGRRACCPLCKADYYVPKPRPEGEDAAAAAFGRANNTNMPQNPQAAWLGNRGGAFRPRAILAPRFLLHQRLENAPFISAPGERRQRRAAEAAARAQAAGEQPASESAASRARNWLPALPRFGRSARDATAATGPAEAASTVTPNDLEAGTRR